MIDRNHPAVKAAMTATLGPPDDNQCWMSRSLTAALPHLTADDLRHTPAGRELMAEGWDQSLAFLWKEAQVIDTGDYSDARIANPYRKDTTHE